MATLFTLIHFKPNRVMEDMIYIPPPNPSSSPHPAATIPRPVPGLNIKQRPLMRRVLVGKHQQTGGLSTCSPWKNILSGGTKHAGTGQEGVVIFPGMWTDGNVTGWRSSPGDMIWQFYENLYFWSVCFHVRLKVAVPEQFVDVFSGKDQTEREINSWRWVASLETTDSNCTLDTINGSLSAVGYVWVCSSQFLTVQTFWLVKATCSWRLSIHNT